MTPDEINQISAHIAQEFHRLRAARQQLRAAPNVASSSNPTITTAQHLAAALEGAGIAPKASKRLFGPVDEQNFLSRFASSLDLVLLYEDLDLQDKARQVIPVDTLHEEAHRLHAETPEKSFDRMLMHSLMAWFKKDFFKWVNQPPCDFCQGKTVGTGNATPTADDLKYGAKVVELYQCESCHKYTRFPRYNDPAKLLETRHGRCGEWANVFALCCKTMGFDTRYVVDFTDHVWTEVYDTTQNRWVHCDSCEGEGAYDTPLMYETGWEKKLTYVIAIGVYDVVDVTRRYSKNPDIWERRVLVDEQWIAPALKSIALNRRRMIPESLRLELACRDKEEEADLKSGGPPNATTSVLPGRQSGAPEWRDARGEMGKPSQ
ncbi:hypothetical protein BATDEDRAFT_86866 [Batrachochytrium dendrobatidis JAM81]|uniref:Transglutaminase-like domain-containing protein n=1 Tax=Batrachochytrium dendrobatidis (strain JAM81 / FGSC 10211) TaxID=684364 RepID=F4NZ18_BATDJ|nr:uncharacterized protein BATDEDRAFT_86866 [Batrachochytrium dendrobatidis JAM81]EGF81807.1 hypothetical protein BATDEDRAFT_86866 [Batrachochytrium dendrobatidis JAM81]|eukprot:XP_006677541.1 hypothetical protein BATDEDRAFT_86866 [Batrachochytrium dendrobatidis JAM81]